MRRLACAAVLAGLVVGASAHGNVREVRYADGTLKVRYEVTEKGRPDGSYIGYHRNGVVRTRGVYVNGKRHGLWLHVDERGYICGYEDFASGGQVYSVRMR
jgi:antitoxin component YwqK of YwqJK toxin-antitoxin module